MEKIAGNRLSDICRFTPAESDETCLKHGCKKKIYPAGWGGETQMCCDACDAEAEVAERYARQRELELHRIKCMLRTIPVKYSTLTIGQIIDRMNHPDHAAALVKLRDWGKLIFDQNFLMLVVGGEYGTGKTEMVCALIGSLLRLNMPVSCRYATCYNLLGEYKQAWDGGGGESLILQSCLDPHLLVLDEVSGAVDKSGEERLAGAFVQRIENIIDSRYLAQKKTLIVGNFPIINGQISGDHLEKLIGKRGASRAQELGATIRCDWPSYRKWASPDCFARAVERSVVDLV